MDFVAESERCPSCNEPQRVYKTRTRHVMTLGQGAFEAREVLKHCGQQGCPVVLSRALSEILPPGQRYGWDLIVHVGMARHLRGMQREEIRAELRELYGIKVSQATISNLCDRFLVALGKLHEHRAPALRVAMKDGYWLHLDATCDLGKGGLFVCLDGWRGWTLLAARIPAENAEALLPLVEKVVEQFGDPIATVRDLGEAGAKAVEPLRKKDIPDLLCHFHFLAAVGKRLFNKPYSRLRNRVRAARVTTELRAILRELRRYREINGYQGRFGLGKVREELLALVLWVLEDTGTKAPSYPFALPWLDFVRRCQRATEQAERWVPSPRNLPERAVIRMLDRLASRLTRDESAMKAVLQLEESWLPFCELRDVLRLTTCDLSLHEDSQVKQIGLPELELLRLRQMEGALTNYGIDLRKQLPTVGKKRSWDCPQAIIVDYLDRYGSGLVGHPAIRDEDGRVMAAVDRTNNNVERFFSGAKQRLRRRVGRALLGRDMELQPAQAALARNLLYPDYVRVVCGSLDNLPMALAKLNGRTTATTKIDRDNRWADVHRCIRTLLIEHDHQLAITPPCPRSQPSAPVPVTVS